MTKTNEQKAGWKQKLFLEITAYWINVLYLTILFAVFTSYRRLILAQYDIGYSNWGISLIKALVLSKVVMIGGLIPFGRGLENKPLIFSTLFKSVLFTLWVAIFALVESAIRGFLHGKGLAGAVDHLLSDGMHEFFAKSLVVFVSFIPFFAFKELGRVLGKGKIGDLFFRKRPVAETNLGRSKSE
jgi:hypothetical protein